jgi:hypothetical protein
MLLATNALIYFKVYEENKQFLHYTCEKLVVTVGAFISLWAIVLHMDSVEEKLTFAMKGKFYFGWIGMSGCSLQSQNKVDGKVRALTSILIPWCCKLTNR